MSAFRVVLIVAGILAGLVGAVELLAEGWDNLVAAVVWLAGGVVLHDAVLAPLVIAVVTLGVLLLPLWARPAAAAAAVVLGSLTLMALPVLGRFGARPDNPTLLDRPYLTGWLVLAALVWTCAGVWALVQRRSGGES